MTKVPPLLSHITFQQAMQLTQAVVKSDPNEGGLIAGTARQVLGAILPGREE